jgi:hypothetical protein
MEVTMVINGNSRVDPRGAIDGEGAPTADPTSVKTGLVMEEQLAKPNEKVGKPQEPEIESVVASKTMD